MAIKHILLPLTGEASGANAAICGLALAKQLCAHVTAGYQDQLGPIYLSPDMVPAELFYDQLRRARTDRKAIARQHFDAAVAAVQLPIVSAPTCQKGSTMWSDDQSGDDAPIAAFGPLTDLVILESPGPEAGFISWNAIEDALFHAHRPTLVVPKSTKTLDFKHVLVAWNGSQEAANALEHAIDLLPPGAKVTILQVGDLRHGSLPAQKAVDYLGWHFIETDLCRIEEDGQRTAENIIFQARRMGADCIVMGAYTHSRTREMMLGGVTDYMLRNADRPVLMAH